MTHIAPFNSLASLYIVNVSPNPKARWITGGGDLPRESYAIFGDKDKALQYAKSFDSKTWIVNLDSNDTCDILISEEVTLFQRKKRTIPIAFERINDGELFTINKDNETYSLDLMKKEYPNSRHMMYRPETLSDKTTFKPIYK